ncbi:hypothetical protein [Metallosphaera javensis (ex Sakai et al. 2022)]|uniref:hypothetical protein n=1 Tax=Metallosphaera javensis (ex Sakai et al. 2022) TaxID=2775498 RepID=UPI00258EBBA5
MSLGPVDRLRAFVKARLRARTRRRFQGRWTKKRTRSYFGLKVFPLISPALFVHGLEVEFANFSDARCCPGGGSSLTGVSGNAVPSSTPAVPGNIFVPTWSTSGSSLSTGGPTLRAGPGTRPSST